MICAGTATELKAGGRAAGDAVDPAPMPVRHHYIGGHKGRFLHMLECGLLKCGSGRPSCLLIHGLGDNAGIWSGVTPPLAAHFHTLVVDLRGHGDSEWDSAGNYCIETHVADMVALIRTLAIDQFVLIGHSLGGNVAIRVASRLRDQVAGLVVVDFGPDLNPAGIEAVRNQLRSADRGFASLAQYEAWMALQRPLVPAGSLKWLAKSTLRRTADGLFRLKSDPKIIEAADDDTHGATQLWPILAKIACPVLVVRGAGSAVLPQSTAERMAEVLQDGRLLLVPAAGHAVMIDNPEGFVAGVLTHLHRFA